MRGRLAAKSYSRKLASLSRSRHKRRMRRLLPFAGLLIAGCAATPPPPPAQPVMPAKPAVTERPETGDLIGLSANELASRFGQPRLQVREGDGTKLQFVAPSCVLDAYLYPPGSGGGLPRVTHVDTRDLQGRDVDQIRCIAAIQAR